MSYRTSALPSSKKTHSEKHKQILKQLSKENANKSCADCKVAKNPRWASWNIGCFICIRCSGIHRSMGTHISKVKSVDLDAWTDEQVEQMIKWGNEKANLYWESQLPDDYTPNQSKIENFIRTKYDLKKWVLSANIPDPMSLKSSQPTPNISTKEPGVPAKPHSETSGSANLLDDDFGSFTSTPSPKPVAPVAPPVAQRGIESHSSQSAQSTGGSMSSLSGRPDLKKSILSLYSSPSSSSSFIQPQQPQQRQQNNMNNLSNSMSGLNFNTSTPSNFTAQAFNSTSTINSGSSTTSFNSRAAPTTNNWSNEWSNTNNSIKTTGLDDDLFKNVWS